MKANQKDLGKVTITCNGLWHRGIEYERLCLVHDGLYSSYISRRNVPVGIELSNADYWQPVASLKEEFKTEVGNIRKEIIKSIAYYNNKLRTTRLVVKDEEERNKLTYQQIDVGCEVYELDTKLTYVLDFIIKESGAKSWHLESDSKIDSIPKEYFECNYPKDSFAERAKRDQSGHIFEDYYVAKVDILNLTEEYVIQHLDNIGAVIKPGAIKPCQLSKQVIEMFGNSSITNMADEEDITVKCNDNNTKVLKFKDKKYIEDSFSGDGLVYLRENYEGNINVLHQIEVDKPNTIYVIKYDFCLAGKTIELPENCTLDFQGGHLFNGAIVLNKTKIKGIVGAISDYIKCPIRGVYADGQLDFKNGKLGYYSNNNFISL